MVESVAYTFVILVQNALTQVGKDMMRFPYYYSYRDDLITIPVRDYSDNAMYNGVIYM